MFSEAAAHLAGLAGALLGWRAEEFWTATPTELATVLRALGGDEALAASSDDLARLIEMFPDESAGEGPPPPPFGWSPSPCRGG